MQILSWNSCGLGLARKNRTVSKLVRDFDMEVCFLFETKLQSYSERLLFQCNLSKTCGGKSLAKFGVA